MDNDFTGVVGIVYFGDFEKFALVRNHLTGNITFPGGGREDYETSPLQTLARELEEETGLKEGEYEITDTGFVHQFVYNSKKKERSGQRGRNVVYLIKCNTLDLKPIDENIKALGWFDEGQVYKKVSFLDLKNIFMRIMEMAH